MVYAGVDESKISSFSRLFPAYSVYSNNTITARFLNMQGACDIFEAMEILIAKKFEDHFVIIISIILNSFRKYIVGNKGKEV